MQKWDKLGEDAMTAYLAQHILPHRFSRCHSFPGKPTDPCRVDACPAGRSGSGWGPLGVWGSHPLACLWLRPLPLRVPLGCPEPLNSKPQDSNALEAINKVLKGQCYFDQVEGLGTVLEKMPDLVERFSKDARVRWLRVGAPG